MTTHVHDPSIEAPDLDGSGSIAIRRPDPAIARPRWLLPALAAVVVATGLVVAGVVSASTVLSVALLGGMLLMHLGGHGHGGLAGHGGHGEAGPGGHGGHDERGVVRDEDLSGGSRGSQPARPDFNDGPDDRASADQNRNETTDHDQHPAHTCH